MISHDSHMTAAAIILTWLRRFQYVEAFFQHMLHQNAAQDSIFVFSCIILLIFTFDSIV